MSHLVSCYADGSKSLIPQRHITRDLCRQRSQKLRDQRWVCFDCAICVVIPKHLTRACQCEWFRGNIGGIEDLESFRVGCVRKEGGAKRVEDASEWCDQPRLGASNAVEHLLLVIPRLTLTTNLCLLVEHYSFDAFLFKLPCRRQA